MARRPKRLYGPNQLQLGVTVTLYTVPPKTFTIVRHIHASNPSTTASGLNLSIGADAAATRLFDNFQVVAGSVLDNYCYYVLEAGEIIQGSLTGGTGNVVAMTIDGDEYTPA